MWFSDTRQTSGQKSGQQLCALLAIHFIASVTVFFRLLASSKLGMQNCKVSRDLNPPIESKLSRDNLDSIGGFKSRDTLQFCIPSLDEASNLKNTVHVSVWGEPSSLYHFSWLPVMVQH